MSSAIAKKTVKTMSRSLPRTKSATPEPARIVTVRHSKGALTPAQFDAIVKEHGGRALTADEKRQVRQFSKDSYP